MASINIAGDTSGTITLSAPLVSGSNTATLPAATGELSMLGTSGQTWQSVTGSRALGTTYTNSTGKPIYIAVTINPANTSSAGTLTVNGVQAGYAQGFVSLAIGITLYSIIPAGATYVISVTGSVTLTSWAELR